MNKVVKRKKLKGIERIKSGYGYKFVAFWTLGLFLFFIIPLIRSIIFAFSTVSIDSSGLVMQNIKFENFRYLLQDDPDYMTNLGESILSFLRTFPIVFVLSLVLALFLNGEYKGRTFFRAIYFLPVIIASGVVLDLLFYTMSSGDLVMAGVSESMSMNMLPLDNIIEKVGLPTQLVNFISTAIADIFDTIWNCGIPIVLFIAGLQTIPDSLYEVSKVEGVTKWEEFWFITLPMLSRVLLLVAVYISVDIMTNKTNVIMKEAYNQMDNLEYGLSASMLWMYFVVIGLILGFVMIVYRKACLKRWE